MAGLSAAVIRKLGALALRPEQMAGVLDIIADLTEADEIRKAHQRERKARSRDKSVTVTGQERDRHSDPPPDKERSPQTPLKKLTPTIPPSLRSGVARARKATRIPDDFVPDLSEAQRLGLTLDQATEASANFVDYWKAKGANATKRDWPATWRVWCRKELKDRPNGKQSSRNGSTPRPSIRLGLARAVARELGEREREADPDAGHQANGAGPGDDLEMDQGADGAFAVRTG